MAGTSATILDCEDEGLVLGKWQGERTWVLDSSVGKNSPRLPTSRLFYERQISFYYLKATLIGLFM